MRHDLLARARWSPPSLTVPVVLARAATRGGTLAGFLHAAWFAWEGGIEVVLAFVALVALGVAATRTGRRRKEALGEAQEAGGKRAARHVIANATPAALFLLCGLAATRFLRPPAHRRVRRARREPGGHGRGRDRDALARDPAHDAVRGAGPAGRRRRDDVRRPAGLRRRRRGRRGPRSRVRRSAPSGRSSSAGSRARSATASSARRSSAPG